MSWHRTIGVGTVRIDRRKLYEQVWSVPVTQLAAQYGISDVGLAKACKRYNIPRPPRGYWAKLHAGQRPKRTPLPKSADPDQSVVYMQGWDMPDETIQTMVTEAKAAVNAAPSRPPPEGPPHPLVEVAREQLMAAKLDHDGLLRTDSATAPDIRVSPPLVERCLGVLDGFIKRWEEKGGSVRVGSGTPAGTAVAVGPDGFQFRIVEAVDESKPLSDPTRRSGHLTLLITGDENRQFRRRWSDTKTQRLEKMYKPLIETLLHALEVKRCERLDAECERRQQERVAAVRKAAERDESKEFYWRQELMENVGRWHDARRIREYLAALQQSIDTGQFRPSRPEAFTQWYEWAKWYADSIDPITRAKQKLEEKSAGPANTPAAELDLTSRMRQLVAKLGVKDTDELWRVTEEQVRKACEGRCGALWNEITRVLEGLGYDVSKRKDGAYWW